MRSIGVDLSALVPSLVRAIFEASELDEWDARPLPLGASATDLESPIDRIVSRLRKLVFDTRICLATLTSLCSKHFAANSPWEASVTKSLMLVRQIATSACGTANTDVKSIMDLAQLIVGQTNCKVELEYELVQMRHHVTQLIGAIQSTKEPVGKASMAPSSFLQLAGISQRVATALETSLDLGASMVCIRNHRRFAQREHERKQQQPIDDFFWADSENENVWMVNMAEIEHAQTEWPEKTGTMNMMIMTLTQVANHGMSAIRERERDALVHYSYTLIRCLQTRSLWRSSSIRCTCS